MGRLAGNNGAANVRIFLLMEIHVSNSTIVTAISL